MFNLALFPSHDHGWYVAPQDNSRWDIHNKNGVFLYGCEEPRVIKEKEDGKEQD